MEFEILIKSFLRPDCLKRAVASIRKFYPNVLIRICDDGHLDKFEGDNIVFYKLPFYSGASVGRNFLVSKVEKPYFLMMDDDMIFTEDTSLHKVLRVLSSSRDIGVVGGRVRENGTIRLGVGRLEVDYTEKYGRRITRYYYGDKTPTGRINDIEVISCRMLPAMYMCKKALFNVYNIKWRDELKRSAHYPFFLDLPLQIRVFCASEVIIDHKPETNPEYDKYKKNNIYYRMICERIVIYKTIYDK